MDGKTVVITGPTSGLGLAAASEFSRLGAKLVLVGRNSERLEQASREIQDFSGRADDHVEIVEAELSLLSEVSRVADQILTSHDRIDVLVNNAGVLPLERQVTEEGHELTLAVNLLAPVLLMRKLAPVLADGGRVVNVASGGMYLSGVNLGDMQSERSFDGSRAYAQAKRALVTLTELYALEWKCEGIDCNSMHPGWAATPGVAKSLPAFNKALSSRLRDAKMGADTIVWLAASAELSGSTGGFWFDRQRHPISVLPGTELSPRRARALQVWVEGVLAPFIEASSRNGDGELVYG
nr:SDR family NAD(P)-dependent oxidoreductase [Litorivivens lipolytica]